MKKFVQVILLLGLIMIISMTFGDRVALAILSLILLSMLIVNEERIKTTLNRIGG